MNADRIIVVENGEILEQGNHDELIVSGGRYADLWSKQVFIRPNDDDKTTEASAGQAGFVNDLSSEQTRTELSKVKPVPSAKDEGGPEQKDVGESSQQKDEGEPSQQKVDEEGAASTPKRTQEVDSAKAN